MSYHLPAQRRPLADSVHPAYSLQPLPPSPTTPLAQAPAPAQAAGMDPMTKKILIGIAVAVVIAAILYWLDQQSGGASRPVKRNRGTAKKMSTGELAKNLYSRLERRGGVSDTTMRSLRALSKNA